MTKEQIIHFLRSLDNCKIVTWLTIDQETNTIKIGYITTDGAEAQQMCAFATE